MRFVMTLHDQSVTAVAESEPAEAALAFVARALAPGVAVEPARYVEVVGGGAEAAEALMRDSASRLVWDYASGLALHAAALVVEGRAVLIVAASGSGKSTLSVDLAWRGMTFLTDELVLVPRGTTTVHPFARPAHLKPGSLFVLQGRARDDDDGILRYEGGALISPTVFPAHDGDPAPLGALVFPRYLAGAPLAIERLSAGAASFALLGGLVNARNLPESGVPECARVASSVPAFRMTYSSLTEAHDALQSALRQMR